MGTYCIQEGWVYHASRHLISSRSTKLMSPSLSYQIFETWLARGSPFSESVSAEALSASHLGIRVRADRTLCK